MTYISTCTEYWYEEVNQTENLISYIQWWPYSRWHVKIINMMWSIRFLNVVGSNWTLVTGHHVTPTHFQLVDSMPDTTFFMFVWSSGLVWKLWMKCSYTIIIWMGFSHFSLKVLLPSASVLLLPVFLSHYYQLQHCQTWTKRKTNDWFRHLILVFNCCSIVDYPGVSLNQFLDILRVSCSNIVKPVICELI